MQFWSLAILHHFKNWWMAESLPGQCGEKRKANGGTKFTFSWNLPENITSSAKSNKFGYCKLYLSQLNILMVV